MALVDEDVLRSKFCQEYNMGASDPFEALDNALANTAKVKPQKYIIAGSPTPDMKEMLSNCAAVVVSDCSTMEPVSQWINVKDRLPDSEDEFLVANINGNIDVSVFGIREQAFLFADRNGYMYKRTLVTHWMPLPEPPKDV